jgi:hypothetical protein
VFGRHPRTLDRWARLGLLRTIRLLTPGERRDLADALLRAAWAGALEETRVVLLDLALATDEQLLWAFA